MKKYLKNTKYLNWKNEDIKTKSHSLTKSTDDLIEKSIILFDYVRDNIIYNPYQNFLSTELYVSSNIINSKSNFCVPKAILLASMARAVKIPSRLGFAHLRNYLLPESFKEVIGSDIIYGHGFTELYLNNKWLKLTPAFDSKMCMDSNYRTVKFNGKDDALFPSDDINGKKHIEYLEYENSYDDFSLEWYISLVKEKYKDNSNFMKIMNDLE
jgi:transglutaminase-like putative cysteine protease